MTIHVKVEIPTVQLVFEKKARKRALAGVGREIEQTAKGLIKTSTKKGISMPGEAPVSRSGALVAGIKSSPSRDGNSVTIKDTVYYSRMLQTGAKGTGKSKKGVLEPRPFITTAYKMLESTIRSRLIRAIDEDITFKKTK